MAMKEDSSNIFMNFQANDNRMRGESAVNTMERMDTRVDEPPSKKRSTFIRKYNTSFIQFGFTSTRDEGMEKPMCVVCGKVLSNDAMKPSKLKRHLMTKHWQLVEKSKEYFERLRDNVGFEGEMESVCNTSEGALTASSKVLNDSDMLGNPNEVNDSPYRNQTPLNGKSNHSYIKFGFVCINHDGVETLQCVICSKSFEGESVKPSKLERHLQMVHKELIGKPKEYFERFSDLVEKESTSSGRPDEAALTASYKMSLRIAKANKPVSIGEELILPCIREVCLELLGEASVSKIDKISVTKETVARRVNELSTDIDVQSCSDLQPSKYFSLYIDESTDITNKAILLAYLRYEDKREFKEEMLCSMEVSHNSEDTAVFEALSGYIAAHGLKWANCVGVCTDGAATMTGSHSYLVARIKETAPNCRIIHCLIHRELLATSEMSFELNSVLNEAIKIVNYIKANAQRTRLFSLLCDNMAVMDQQFLLHTEMRWLSRGKGLSHVLELRNELALFLLERKPEWSLRFQEPGWVIKLAYLADIFSFLNELNYSLQGKMASVFQMFDKIYAFKKKLRVWEERVSRYSFDMFPTCASFIDEGVQDFYIQNLSVVIVGHLRSLQGEFDAYFPEHRDPRSGNEWIRNPFAIVNLSRTNLNAVLGEKLMELSSDKEFETLFESEITISEFWIKVRPIYPELSDQALRLLLLFPSTHLCDAGFLAFSSLKTYRNWISLQAPHQGSQSYLDPNTHAVGSYK